MRILMAHNYYQHPGGEDQVFAAESRLLEERGHTVLRLTRDYSLLKTMSKASIARASVWSSSAYNEVRRIVREQKVDVAHFHNTFPLLSPAAYYAARAENVPVVQTLHNYRLLCPGALFYREGRVCEDCLGHAIPWSGVRHSCYRGSAAQTAALAGMLSLHRMARTWSRAVDVYVALTEFARRKFISGGLPAERVRVKPNFMVSDPGQGNGSGGFALFAGRVTKDKGVQVLIDAWRRFRPGIRLRIAGDGPLLDQARADARDLSEVEFLGSRSRAEVLELMKEAAVLVVPSLWYEGFPMTIVEAYACGLPVVASDLGSLSSVVEDGVTGSLFPVGESQALALAVDRLIGAPAVLRSLRANARATYEKLYSAEPAYSGLLSVYEAALRGTGRRMSQELVHA